jgi:hypothetical protein
MNARTQTLCRSMRKAITVVDTYPDLRRHANESKAFELFVAVVDDLEALEHDQGATRLEIKELIARKKRVTADINLIIAVLCTTAQLIPPSADPLPRFSAPSSRAHTFVFASEVAGLVEMAAKHAGAFVDAGLHPLTFDQARDLIATLVDLDDKLRQVEAYAGCFNHRLSIGVDTARKRQRQLYLELQRAMSSEANVAWRNACALGRAHRRKALPPASEQKLLSAPSDASSTEGNGIVRLARQVGHLLARPESA